MKLFLFFFAFSVLVILVNGCTERSPLGDFCNLDTDCKCTFSEPDRCGKLNQVWKCVKNTCQLLVSEDTSVSEKKCTTDADCACGRHRTTRECFYGNKRYVDVSDNCPDFCSGIHGGFQIRCVASVCIQQWR